MHPFTATTADSVSTLGELRLIAAIRRWLGNATPPSPARSPPPALIAAKTA